MYTHINVSSYMSCNMLKNRMGTDTVIYYSAHNQIKLHMLLDQWYNLCYITGLKLHDIKALGKIYNHLQAIHIVSIATLCNQQCVHGHLQSLDWTSGLDWTGGLAQKIIFILLTRPNCLWSYVETLWPSLSTHSHRTNKLGRQ